MSEELDHVCPQSYECKILVTLEVIGGKWKGIILFHLMNGPLRFNELKRRIPAVTQRMLTLQLRELESDGIVSRHIYRQIPPKVDYTLTPFGESLKPLIDEMRNWGEKYENILLTERNKETQEHEPSQV
ncbi:transcriptional regulator [Paenibacillus amylolyticus]|uniref:Transcriptional regulator n=2 Tax=Paenibacillus amylolyticus TaxID=1451 RepID=A0A1R1BHF7_PAEAM|nr:helix-turn-helix domain-containing protein [Paenibacillus amylolyticus]OMF07192.1 transcriptional regulator [Paenibacillus amylolyticus]